MVTNLANGTRRARKHHQCWHCYRDIAPGETYGFQSNVYDGRAYTLKFHLDCEACSSECRRLSGNDYYDEGYPPLRDEWIDNGEYKNECDNWRGFFPHVVARMELTDQLRGKECPHPKGEPHDTQNDY